MRMGRNRLSGKPSDSLEFKMTPGMCHQRLGCGGEGTWGLIQRGALSDSQGRGCCWGQGWRRVGAAQHQSCVTEGGEVGKGTSRFPALSQPRLGNGDVGRGSTGSWCVGAEEVARGLPGAAVPSPVPAIKVAKCVPGYGSTPGNKTLAEPDAFLASPCEPGEPLPLPLPLFPPKPLRPAAEPGGGTAAGSPW